MYFVSMWSELQTFNICHYSSCRRTRFSFALFLMTKQYIIYIEAVYIDRLLMVGACNEIAMNSRTMVCPVGFGTVTIITKEIISNLLKKQLQLYTAHLAFTPSTFQVIITTRGARERCGCFFFDSVWGISYCNMAQTRSHFIFV